MIRGKEPIVMIAATPFFSDRGCHVRIYNEMKYLQKEGIEVTLVTYHVGNDIGGFDIRRIKQVSWYKKLTPGASFGKLYLDFKLLLLTFKTVRSLKPTILHAHLYEGLLIAWVVKLFSFRRMKIVFDCQGSLAEEMYAYTLHKSVFLKPFYYIFMAIEKVLLYIPNNIVCSSENSYNFLREKYYISKKRMVVVDDGIDTDLFKPVSADEKGKARDAFGIAPSQTVILYTGSLTEAKGVKELLDAVPAIVEKNRTVTFIFAGYGNLEVEYKEKLAPLASRGAVHFTGRFSYFDLPKYTVLADFCIDPKKGSSESSGKLLNYIAAGVPVICFKNDFNFSVLKDNGMYIQDFSEISDIHTMHRTMIQTDPNRSSSEIIKKFVEIYGK